jgi:hypothetical protein
MEKLNCRFITSQNESLNDSDEVVMFTELPHNEGGVHEVMSFVVPGSKGDGKHCYIKNISGNSVNIHISGFYENTSNGPLNFLSLQTGQSLHLFAYAPGAWTKL